MKQIIAMLAVALVAAMASAEQYFAIVNTGAYAAKDKNPSDANAGYYSGYLCTVESAATYFGGNTSAADLTSYVAANYAMVLASLGAATEADGVLKLSADAEGFSDGQYAVAAYTTAALGSEYLALVLYDDGENEAFRAFGLGNGIKEGGGVAFDDIGATAGTVGAWTTASNVPEPTSGLLVLLGLAGLALKRRR